MSLSHSKKSHWIVRMQWVNTLSGKNRRIKGEDRAHAGWTEMVKEMRRSQVLIYSMYMQSACYMSDCMYSQTLNPGLTSPFHNLEETGSPLPLRMPVCTGPTVVEPPNVVRAVESLAIVPSFSDCIRVSFLPHTTVLPTLGIQVIYIFLGSYWACYGWSLCALKMCTWALGRHS